MLILHITNDFSGSTVYKNLCSELDNIGLPQIIYSPVKEKNRIGKNQTDLNIKYSKLIYSHILNRFSDRIFYKKKIRKIVADIEKKVDITKITIIHAHTWYSDGGVAYLLSKKYNIPYIVAIRNTDLNLFQKYMFFERGFGKKILANANNIILISASYKNRILELSSLRAIKHELLSKLIIIPNGIDSFWIKNYFEKKSKNNNDIFNLLFIGKFTRGKNILALQLAVKEINRIQKIVHLHLIGGEGGAHKEVLKLVSLNQESMTFHGKILDLIQLKKHFENADIFAMPSKRETFGLVYVEALLQGLPILYTANEGIDGFYEEKIGEKVKVGNVEEIKDRLLQLMENYETYCIPSQKLIENHDWKKIAIKYRDLYNLN